MAVTAHETLPERTAMNNGAVSQCHHEL